MNWYKKISMELNELNHPDPFTGQNIIYAVNPTIQELKGLLQRSRYRELRGVIVNGDLYVWDGMTHYNFVQKLFKMFKNEIYQLIYSQYSGDGLLFILDNDGNINTNASNNDIQFIKNKNQYAQIEEIEEIEDPNILRYKIIITTPIEKQGEPSQGIYPEKK